MDEEREVWVQDIFELVWKSATLIAAVLFLVTYTMEAKGFVARSRIDDVRTLEALGEQRWLAACDRDVGLIRVLTMGIPAPDAVLNWWHEYYHCYVWPKKTMDEVATLKTAYDQAVLRRMTEEPDMEEWAAEEFTTWCAPNATGHPVFLALYNDTYRQTCRPDLP